MLSVPTLTPALSFDEACAAVVDYLTVAVPMGLWMVSRYDGYRQLYLAIRDTAYGKVSGDAHPWQDSYCQFTVTGTTPNIAPDASLVPEYATAGINEAITIGAYVGLPIARASGEVFGTLCGLNPEAMPAELEAHAPLLQLLSMLLGTILEADLSRTEQSRLLERALLEAETDALTGLANRRGWDRFLAIEEDRWRRFGDPGSVVVLDLDRLKAINDDEGHDAGDEHLRRAAGALRSVVRDADMVARLGGDEFGVVASRSTPAQTVALIERLEAALSAVGVSGSFGWAAFGLKGGFWATWADADAAMYLEKLRRKDQP